MTRNLKQFSTLVKVVIAIGSIYWLLSSDKLVIHHLLSIFKNPPVTFLIIACFGLSFYFVSERLRLILNLNSIKYGILPIYKLTIVGMFFSFVVPGGVGGDFIKGLYISRDGNYKKRALFSILLLDRIFGLISLTSISTIFLLIESKHVNKIPIYVSLSFPIFLLTFCGFGFIFLLSNAKAQDLLRYVISIFNRFTFVKKIESNLDIIFTYKGKFFILMRVLLLSYISQFFIYLTFIIISETLSPSLISINQILVTSPICFLITTIPISPGGLGVGQIAFHTLYELYKPGTGAIGAITISVAQSSNFLYGLLGLIVYLKSKNILK